MRLSLWMGRGAALIAVAVCVTSARAAGPSREGLELFEKKIRPVLSQKCYQCHSASVKEAKGGLRLDTRAGLLAGGESGAAIVPGDAKQSLLIEALRHEGLEMPPKEQLDEAVIADFEKWIELGAPDPRHGKGALVKQEIDLKQARQFWAYQPPHAAQVPVPRQKGWPRTDIDRFVLARLEKEGLPVVGDADRATFLRRATFDLTGLPPTPQELDQFLDDTSTGAFAAVVDRLLATPQFGERWGRHWLDVARYAESSGKERNIPYAYAWRYRDYVIDAFNSDKPYDQFVREQVAGDLLPAGSDAQRNEQTIATGFLALGPKSLNGGNREQFLLDVVDEQVDVTCRAILATTVSCARCHDHKFDPIPTTDYYALAGIFYSTETLSGVQAKKGKDYAGELYTLVSDKASDKAGDKAAAESAAALKARADEIAAVETEIAGIEKRLQQQKKQAKRKNLTKEEARKMQQQEGNPRRQLKLLQAQLAELKKGDPVAGDLAMAVRDSGKPTDIRICVRGEIKERGPAVPRGFVSVLSPDGAQPTLHGSGRLEFANWLVSRKNPLAARVIVNRVWQHLLGAGLVETVDNFGALGEEPSHPELLDTLAVRFMEQGWSIKQLIREIMLSHVYQLSSAHHDGNYAVDPQNRLLWRAARRRLDAEALRDATLAVSGQLDLKRPFASPVMQLGLEEVGRKGRGQPLPTGEQSRSVYLPILRGALPEMLNVFDGADPSLVVGQRDVTTVATQALFMLNSPFMLEQSQHAARRLLNEAGLDDAGRVDRLYRTALGRVPTTTERNRILHYLHEYERKLAGSGEKEADQALHAWSSICQTLLASAEFQYVY